MEQCPSWGVDDSHSPTYIIETGDEHWALCTSWQGEGLNLHKKSNIFHNKGNNSGDGLTSPVTILMDDIVGM